MAKEEKTSAIKRVENVPVRVLFSSPDVRVVIDTDRYLDKKGNIVFRESGRSIPAEDGIDYQMTKNGTLVKNHDDTVRVKAKAGCMTTSKAPGTPIFIVDNSVYVVSGSLALVKIDVMDDGNACETAIKRVSRDSSFHVVDDGNIIVCNLYGSRKVVDVSGKVIVMESSGTVTNGSIRFDPVNSWWMLATRNDAGVVDVCIVDRSAGLIYRTDKIDYKHSLETWAFHNGFIYMPMAGSIARFDFRAPAVKEFKVPVVDWDTALVKTGGKIVAIGNKEIHEIG